MQKNILILAALAPLVSGVSPRMAHATENASGFYLLGFRGPLAGVTPPPGTYVSSFTFLYRGRVACTADEGAALCRSSIPGTEMDAAFEGALSYDVPSVLHVLPEKILGGHLGFGGYVPVGWKEVRSALNLRSRFVLPGSGAPIESELALRSHDGSGSFGDPVAGALLGWHAGNLHWNAGTFLNIPVGFWEKGNLASIGFNHWGLDVNFAVTWLDPKTGFEASAAAGFTFNWENPATRYTSGTEFHAEFALIQHLSDTIGIGLAGHSYDQVTGDSGAGATLGSFKGRVTALGPVLVYSFEAGGRTVTTNAKWTHEFASRNRTEGTNLQVSFTVPLGAAR